MLEKQIVSAKRQVDSRGSYLAIQGAAISDVLLNLVGIHCRSLEQSVLKVGCTHCQIALRSYPVSGNHLVPKESYLSSLKVPSVSAKYKS